MSASSPPFSLQHWLERKVGASDADRRIGGDGEMPRADGADAADGRHRRSARSRRKIAEAMFALIRGGDMDPSAAALAETAGVSLRTVFRHFEEMDLLYREMNEKLEAEILPILLTPFAGKSWRDRLSELVTRRAIIYERILPLKVAGNARRFQSEFLMDGYRRFVAMERAGLQAVLPDEIRSDARRFAALEVVTGFEAWQRMRQDQELSSSEAEAVMHMIVARLSDA